MDKKEQSQTKRLPGFYIALCCSVIAIGIAGYFTEKSAEERQSENIISHETGGEESVAVNETADNIDAAKKEDAPILEYIPEPEENAAAADISDTEETANEPAEAAAVIVGTPTFTLGGGEIAAGFSEELTYNAALGDWRTHNGVDIAVESGESVAAVADGTVSEISSDEMGEYVVTEHDGGFTVKYRGKSSVEDLSVGDEIKSGSVIGIVTESKAENLTEPHLHLEMYKDSKLVNPSDYLR